jgi:dCTP deaminase
MEGIYTSPSEKSFKSKEDIKIEKMYQGNVSVEYPDRYITELSFEELHQEMTRRAELRQKVEAREFNTTIEIKTDKPIAIGWFADTHAGNSEVDYERLKWEVDEIKDNPYMKVLLGGDIADSFCFNPAQFGDIANLDEQYLYLRRMLDYMGYDNVLGAVVGNHECLDEETEACTKDGWKRYTDLSEEDYLLTVDKDMVSSWQKPSKIIVQEFDGELNSFQSKNIDMLVTDDHKVALVSRKSKEIQRIKAKEVAETKPFDYKEFIMAGENQNKEYKIEDCWIELIAWIITDGWLTRTSCGISQRVQKAHLPRAILDKCKASYKEKERRRDVTSIMGKVLKSVSPSIEFNIHSETRKKIEKLLPDGKYQLPGWLWKLSRRQFDLFLNSLIDADGSRKTKTARCFYQKSKELIDDLQTLCAMNGRRTTIYQYYGDQYRLNICDRPTIRAVNTEVSKKPYKGIVWDVTVPNHVFLVRRNGKAYFTGNSWARRTGLDMYTDIRKNIPVFDGVGTIDLILKDVDTGESVDYTGAIMHKSKGNSYFNPNHGGKRFSMENEGYDFVMTAHTHQGAEQSQIKPTSKGSRKIVFLSGKTFKSGDDFLDKQGHKRLDNDGLGTNWILFNHKKKMMIPLSSTAEVLEVMVKLRIAHCQVNRHFRIST